MATLAPHPVEADHDIAIVGAGPAGLCFARALADSGLRVILLECQPEAALANPAFDGREIALTHRSVHTLQQLDIWQRIPPSEIFPLRNARILNGLSSHALRVDHRDSGCEALGYLVPNHWIRKAAFDAVRASPTLTLRTGVTVRDIQVDGVQTNDAHARVCFSSRAPTASGRPANDTAAPPPDETLYARLLVAADSRFSESRRAMGVPARMHDFGKSMMVCRMAHEIDHEQNAWEWFGHGQTIAMLPLAGHSCSVVLTLPGSALRALEAMDDSAFGTEITRRMQGRLGAMRPISTRHVYPLVGVYPERFVARCFALIGDAAVGMHPVTAHGFNFGLLSQQTLSAAILSASANGTDIAAPALLRRYEYQHRRATLPLYLATQAIVTLFTDDRMPAHLLRSCVLRASASIAPLGRVLARVLADRPLSPRSIAPNHGAVS